VISLTQFANRFSIAKEAMVHFSAVQVKSFVPSTTFPKVLPMVHFLSIEKKH
jgi:hypothetical protein